MQIPDNQKYKEVSDFQKLLMKIVRMERARKERKTFLVAVVDRVKVMTLNVPIITIIIIIVIITVTVIISVIVITILIMHKWC